VDWLKNAGDGKNFSEKDIGFECFHNFVAFSQWGNTIFGIMSRLSENGGDIQVRDAFRKTMTSEASDSLTVPLVISIVVIRRKQISSKITRNTSWL
jgi:hypothetical protein